MKKVTNYDGQKMAAKFLSVCLYVFVEVLVMEQLALIFFLCYEQNVLGQMLMPNLCLHDQLDNLKIKYEWSCFDVCEWSNGFFLTF